MDFQIVQDVGAINQALYQVTHGLYVLTSRMEDRVNGQCLDALMQVTNMPPRVAIGVNKRTLTHEMIAASGLFVANVIDRTDTGCFDCVKHFGFQSGRKVEKFADCAFERGELGAPILACAKAFYECRVCPECTLDLKTHTLFVGDVVRAGTRDEGEPLTYNEYRKAMKKP
jgi:flavin reductase (DIM6/NTAB) family NADH-FMN oxidoreductase RutF